MTTPEVFARLTPNSIDCTRERVDGQKRDDFAEVVKMVVAKCSFLTARYGLAKYTDGARTGEWPKESTPKTLFMAHLRDYVIKHKVLPEGWDKRKNYTSGQITAFCRVVVDECLDSSCCRTCKGQGTRMVADKFQNCHVCAGSGFFPWSHKRRAEAMGVPRTTYLRVWKRRFDDMALLINDLETELWYQVNLHVSG